MDQGDLPILAKGCHLFCMKCIPYDRCMGQIPSN